MEMFRTLPGFAEPRWRRVPNQVDYLGARAIKIITPEEMVDSVFLKLIRKQAALRRSHPNVTGVVFRQVVDGSSLQVAASGCRNGLRRCCPDCIETNLRSGSSGLPADPDLSRAGRSTTPAEAAIPPFSSPTTLASTGRAITLTLRHRPYRAVPVSYTHRPLAARGDHVKFPASCCSSAKSCVHSRFALTAVGRERVNEHIAGRNPNRLMLLCG
ncbi:MAG: hypothetical protein H6569_10520 [Lewinellaceae bacterium]|nr:hypothetical protein [Lewinellaceae bacterium]